MKAKITLALLIMFGLLVMFGHLIKPTWNLING